LHTEHKKLSGNTRRLSSHGEIIVKDPDIPLSQVEAVQNEVFLLLENNGRSPEPTPTEISENSAPPEAESEQNPPPESPDAAASESEPEDGPEQR
jgi:hypothetical protein